MAKAERTRGVFDVYPGEAWISNYDAWDVERLVERGYRVVASPAQRRFGFTGREVGVCGELSSLKTGLLRQVTSELVTLSANPLCCCVVVVGEECTPVVSAPPSVWAFSTQEIFGAVSGKVRIERDYLSVQWVRGEDGREVYRAQRSVWARRCGGLECQQYVPSGVDAGALRHELPVGELLALPLSGRLSLGGLSAQPVCTREGSAEVGLVLWDNCMVTTVRGRVVMRELVVRRFGPSAQVTVNPWQSLVTSYWH